MSVEHIITNKPINIGDNNVRFENVKISWEVDKVYRTRAGEQATVYRISVSDRVHFRSQAHGYFSTYYDGKRQPGIEGPCDIVGPWEEEKEMDDLIIKQVQENHPVSEPEITWKVGGLYKTKSGIALKLIGIYETIEHGARIDFRRLGENSETFLYNKDGTLCGDQGHPNPDGMAIVHDPDAGLYDYQNDKARSERKVKVRYVPSDYAGAHLRDINTPDDRRPRVDLRTGAQIAHDRAVLRLRQHRLARWGLAESVRWEDE